MKISFKNFKFGKGFLSISLDNGKNFQNINVADIEKSGFLLSDNQDLSAIKIKGPSSLLKSLDVISSVKVQNNDEIVFTYLKNVGEFKVEIPENGFMLESVLIPITTASTYIYISDDSNSYSLGNLVTNTKATTYNELKTHYKELMEKDNLKLELVFRNEITDESGNTTYEEKSRISLKNKIKIKEYEVDNYDDFCDIVSDAAGYFTTVVKIGSTVENFIASSSSGSYLTVPLSCKDLEINLYRNSNFITRNMCIYYFGSLSEFNNNVSVKISKMEGAETILKKYPKVYVYDRYNNSRLLA